ncbi:MAG TPA: single-stranded-DNA-specific exonuclease RecJ [Aggregatilineales bacterium]|nr:single-stranded-DNA-specific exonuclease RecJ [Anaerolineales bacterium]HRE49264.1 single-stranded-DNA-specific exonuclease RecJ [Aggregatilineales bacterium]
MSLIQRPWVEPSPVTPSEVVLAACGGDALIATILTQRGFTDPEHIRAFLDPDSYEPTPPETLPDLVSASTLLAEALRAEKKILIWGDFDADGQTATALLYEGLTRLGGEAAYYVPNRQSESHGIGIERLREQIARHAPAVLITCDTGITEYESIQEAKRLGLTVIITDHHNLGDHLPPADAVINPKRLAETTPHHPLITLPGVGVAYKLMQHLYITLDRAREVGRLLDLVALGIVSDVAEQVNDTRFLLQIGLSQLRRAERVGLAALMAVAKIQPEALTAEDLGFQLGPRLNAVGRLGDAALAVELLVTRDAHRAATLAQTLEGLNNERKLLSRQVEESAEAMLERDRTLLDHAALVMYNPEWQAGILGIAANTLAGRYGRPVVLLTGDGDSLSGSARTAGGYDIGGAIAQHGEMLERYGGHFGAAGLSLQRERLDQFRRRLSRTLVAMGGKQEIPPLQIDCLLPLSEITDGLAYRLEKLSPFGEGNPPVVAATKGVHLSHAAILGRDERHLKLTIEDDSGASLPVLWWGGAERRIPEGVFDIAFLPKMRRGELQLEFVDYRETGEVWLEDVDTSAITILDWRRDPAPAHRLAILLEDGTEAQVWAEGFSRQTYPHFKRRADLSEGETLIIYSAPPDPKTLAAVIARVQPQTIHLFGIDPPIADLPAFLRLLQTATRNVIAHFGGRTTLDILSGAIAGSRAALRAGLDFLALDGQITLSWVDENTLTIGEGDGTSAGREVLKRPYERLVMAFEEMNAYRRYFRVLPTKQIVREA